MAGYLGPKAIQYNVDNSNVENDSNVGGDLTVGGNVLVGKTSSSFSSDGVQLQNNGEIYVTRTAGPPVSLNRKTSDGSMLQFAKDGSTVGSIGSISGDLGIGTGDCGIKFVDQNKTIYPANPSSDFTNNDATVSLGVAANRFKDLYLSGGVYLGGTDAVNKLDSYEEGTFVPSLSGDNGASGQVYTEQTGRYIRVGNQVTCWVRIKLSNKGSLVGGAVGLVGCAPFAVADRSAHTTAAEFNNLATAWSLINIRVAGFFYLRGIRDKYTSMAFLGPADISNTSQFFFSYTYEAT
jgi:hypothetical protein